MNCFGSGRSRAASPRCSACSAWADCGPCSDGGDGGDGAGARPTLPRRAALRGRGRRMTHGAVHGPMGPWIIHGASRSTPLWKSMVMQCDTTEYNLNNEIGIHSIVAWNLQERREEEVVVVVVVADINSAHPLPFCFVFTAMRACQDAEAKRLLKEAEAAIETRKDFRRVMACHFF